MLFRWIIFLFFSCYLTTANSQDIYYVTQDNEIFRFDLQNNSSTLLYSQSITGIGNILDIAFDTQGTLYAITNYDIILEIDLINQSYQIVSLITSSGTFPGLVSNAQNELFFAGWFNSKLFKFNPISQTTEELTQGISTPGDFTFYKGNLLFPNGNENTIGAYTGSDIQSVGCANGLLFSLVNVFTDCDNNAVYGIDDQNNLYSYDIGTNTQNFILQINAPNTIFGAATMSEAFASDCPLTPFQQIDCNLSIEEYNQNNIKIFPNPVNSELNFQVNNLQIDKLILRDITGRKVVEYKDVVNKISTSNLEVGCYFIEVYIHGNNQPIIKKIIKK